MRIIDGGNLLFKLDKMDQQTFTKQEVKDLIMAQETMSVHICHKRNEIEYTEEQKEYIRKDEDRFVLGRFVAAIGYDYHTDYEPHIYPTWSDDTLFLWEQVKKRMKGTQYLSLDGDGYLEELKKERDNQAEIIEDQQKRRDLYDTSFHYGLMRGFSNAINLLDKHTHPEAEKNDQTRGD